MRSAGDSHRPGSRLCKDDTRIIQAYGALIIGWVAAASSHRKWNVCCVRRITRCRVNNRPGCVRKWNLVMVGHLKYPQIRQGGILTWGRLGKVKQRQLDLVR